MIKYIFLITLFLNFSSIVSAKPTIKARTGILIDYHSDEILYELDSDAQIYPASMTKIMTAIVAFDLLKKNKISLDDKFTISENAWRLSQSGYSSMFIMINDQVSVENLLKGIIIASGNDACVALAEGIAGSEENFAQMMNEKAGEIGLSSSNFANSSGINDPDNTSTVRDIALMSKYLIKNYPEYYTYFKELEFTWDRTGSDPITQPNTNSLLSKNKFVDGIKTGYLAVEKYSLASSIERNGRRLIAVGSGFKTKGSRSYESNKLLNYGLSQFATIEIAKQNQIFTALEVWQGKKGTVSAYINQDIYKTLLKSESLNRQKYLKVTINYKGPIKAPIKKDDIIGKLKIVYKKELVSEHDLFAYEDIKKLNVFSRLMKSINFLIWGDV